MNIKLSTRIFILSLSSIFVGCLLSLTFLEITLRSDSLRRLLLPKSRITKNIASFQNITKDITARLKETKPKKILILGDSFIRKGHMVDKKIKELLDNKTTSILNLAYSGYSPTQYLATFRNFAYKFKPTITVIAYYVGNDLTDTKYRFGGKNLKLNEAGLIQPHKNIPPPIQNKFYSLDFFRKSYQNRRKQKGNISLWQKAELVDPYILNIYETKGMNPWLIELGIVHKDFLLSNLMLSDKSDLIAWRKNAFILSQIQQQAKEINSQTVIVIFPHSAQINTYHYNLFKKLHITTKNAMLSTSRPQDLLMDFCSESNLKCLNLLPYYRDKKDSVMFWKFDDHMNNKGQKYAGTLIANFLDNL